MPVFKIQVCNRNVWDAAVNFNFMKLHLMKCCKLTNMNNRKCTVYPNKLTLILYSEQFILKSFHILTAFNTKVGRIVIADTHRSFHPF